MSNIDKHSPKLSVIIPLYNHERYIKEAIYSVLGQSFGDFELIIINDGSTDKSEEVVKSIKDDRIKYYYQENQGAHNTINRGIQLARGKYVSILNSDDVYYKNRFEEALKVLESDSSIRAVFSHMEFIDEKGDFIRFSRGAEDNWKDKNEGTSFKGKNDVVIDLLAGNFLMTTSNLFCRRSVFKDIGYFSNLRYTHDYDFFLRLCSHYKTYIMDIPLLKYRMHNLNTIKNNEAEVSFEVGLILANFFLNYDKENIFEDEVHNYNTMLKLFNSVNTYNADKMIMVLLIYATRNNLWKERLFKDLTQDTENSFRKICVDSFKARIDQRKALEELNERLVRAREELRKSYSYRLGRVITWPLRKVLGTE